MKYKIDKIREQTDGVFVQVTVGNTTQSVLFKKGDVTEDKIRLFANQVKIMDDEAKQTISAEDLTSLKILEGQEYEL